MTAWIVLALGVVILVCAVVALFRRVRFLATAVTRMAIVTAVRESETRSNSESDPAMVTVYHSRFRFTTPDGAVHQFEHPHGTREPSFRVGEEVAVRYTPADPAKSAELPSLLYEFRNWFFIVVPGILGLGMLLAGLRTLGFG